MAAIDENTLISIAIRHLELVKAYNPYANFSGVSNRKQFISVISNDPAFRHFGFADDKYVIARIGGNLITSLHRKLGDMYEDIFAYLLKQKFNISDRELAYSVDVLIGGRSQTRSTDGLIPKSKFDSIQLPRLAEDWKKFDGIGFELRSCYQIGDSKRIQADYDMALALKDKNIVPVMLVFCKTSLKSPILRLRKSWNIFEGEEAFGFIKDLTDFDLLTFLKTHERALSKPVSEVLANL